MKYLYSFLAVILLSFFVQAQTIGLSISGGVPTGNFKDYANANYIGGLFIQAPIKGFTGVLYGGYGFWDEKSSPAHNEVSYNNFPVVLAGARSYFGDFYLSTLAGIYPTKMTVKTDGGELEESETQAAISASLGTVFPVSFFHADISISYFWTQDYPQLQMTLGVLFNR